MRTGWLLLALAAGCVQSASPVCGDGSVCPPGASCLVGGGCRNDRCGHGVLEGNEGEECDDGNALDHDGCSSACRSEHLQWSLAEGAEIPPRTEFAAAWDADRGRGLLHGGEGSPGRLGDTWSWTGTTWEPAAAGPLPVSRHALAPDGSGALVLAGGASFPMSSLQLHDQCWTWDGAWHECSALPSKISDLRMTQDPAGGVIVAGGLYVDG